MEKVDKIMHYQCSIFHALSLMEGLEGKYNLLEVFDKVVLSPFLLL